MTSSTLLPPLLFTLPHLLVLKLALQVALHEELLEVLGALQHLGLQLFHRHLLPQPVAATWVQAAAGEGEKEREKEGERRGGDFSCFTATCCRCPGVQAAAGGQPNRVDKVHGTQVLIGGEGADSIPVT